MPKKLVDDAPEWIAAHEALQVLYPHHGGWLGTKFLLAELLKDGRLRGAATRLWTSDAPSIGAAWKCRHSAAAEEDVEIPRSVWASSRYWMEDLANWRWPDDRFLITQSKKPAKRTFLEGVEFDRAQIMELLPQKNRKGIGGRQIRATDWAKIGVALIDLANEGRFPPSEAKQKNLPPFANVGDFIAAVLERADEPYAVSHAHSLLSPVYYHFYPETQRSSYQNEDADSF